MKLLILILFILFNYSNATCIAERKKQKIKQQRDLFVFIPICDRSNPDLYRPLQYNAANESFWCVDVNSGKKSDHVEPFSLGDFMEQHENRPSIPMYTDLQTRCNKK